MIQLTLAGNHNPVLINRDNIAFAVPIEDKDVKFTRIYLKQVAVKDEPPFVDVEEGLREIATRRYFK